jgi:ectoine hydroxylase-related dioxygenase (phytanoyl-CoA dioxygenase family)
MRDFFMQNLTKQQIEGFHKDGFLLVKNCFSDVEIAEIVSVTEKFNAKKPVDWKKGNEMAYYETSKINSDDRILMRVENIVDYYQIFNNTANSEKILGIIEKVIGEPCVLFKDKINFKNIGGGGFRPHQDKTVKWAKFGSMFISAMITLTESTVENGCLEVAQGIHKHGWITEHPNSGLLTEQQIEEMNFVKIPTKPGDVIFFDSFTPHRSKNNYSKEQRINMYLTYNKKNEGDHRSEYFLEKRREFPPDNERSEGSQIKNSEVHEALYSSS